MLLDGRLLKILAERLDIGGDVQRFDIGDLADLVLIAPGEEPHAGIVYPDSLRIRENFLAFCG